MDSRKIATVLEAAANYVEAVEREKAASADAVKAAVVSKLAAAHATAHGDELPDEVRAKLAGVDPAVLSYVESVLQKAAATADSLGIPVNTDDNQPSTVKEAADAADKRFETWLLS
jgi:hypothetical protein